MSQRAFGAAAARPRLRPRTVEVPLPDVHPDDAYEDRQDHLEALYETEQRLDRLDDHEGRPWPSGQVVALPVAEPQAESRAA